MKLAPDAMFFDFHGIPILGSPVTGAVIGLTDEGLAVCRKMAIREVGIRELEKVDANLPKALEQCGLLAGRRAEYLSNAENAIDMTCPEESGHPNQSEHTRSPKYPTAPVHVSKTRSAYVHVTQRCNLSCVGCYSDNALRNRLADADVESFARAFATLHELGVANVVISGGEPFLRDDLAPLCKSARDHGMTTIRVISNGTIIRREALEALAPYVDSVSISFDGANAEAPSHIRHVQNFDNLCNAVRMVQAAGIHAHIIPTIHRLNIGDLPTYSQLAADLGVTYNFSLLSCCTPSQPEDENMLFDEHSLRALAKNMFSSGAASSSHEPMADTPVDVNLSCKTRCGAADSTLSIGADGTVYPCHMLQDMRFSLGNAFRDSAAAIKRAMGKSLFACYDVRDSAECGSCRYAPVCGGGCRARAVHATGRAEAKDPYCPLIEEFYNLLGELLARRFEI